MSTKDQLTELYTRDVFAIFIEKCFEESLRILIGAADPCGATSVLTSEFAQANSKVVTIRADARTASEELWPRSIH